MPPAASQGLQTASRTLQQRPPASMRSLLPADTITRPSEHGPPPPTLDLAAGPPASAFLPPCLLTPELLHQQQQPPPQPDARHLPPGSAFMFSDPVANGDATTSDNSTSTSNTNSHSNTITTSTSNDSASSFDEEDIPMWAANLEPLADEPLHCEELLNTAGFGHPAAPSPFTPPAAGPLPGWALDGFSTEHDGFGGPLRLSDVGSRRSSTEFWEAPLSPLAEAPIASMLDVPQAPPEGWMCWGLADELEAPLGTSSKDLSSAAM